MGANKSGTIVHDLQSKAVTVGAVNVKPGSVVADGQRYCTALGGQRHPKVFQVRRAVFDGVGHGFLSDQKQLCRGFAVDFTYFADALVAAL